MIKLGFVNEAKDGLLSIDDVIKLDIKEVANVDVTDSSFGFSTVQRRPLRAMINLEMDWLSENNYGLLRKYMNNRTTPQKLFISHPADASQYIDYGLTNPYTGIHVAYWMKSNDASRTPAQIQASGTAFNDAAYVDPSTQWYAYQSVQTDNTRPMYLINTTTFYTHLLFKVKLTDWIALFTSQVLAVNAIRRLTLFCSNLEMYDANNNYSYNVNVWDNTNGLWLEVARKYYHVVGGVAAGLRCHQTNAIRTQEGFTNYSDLVDNNGFVTIRISNIIPSGASNALSTRLNYLSLLVNGYGIAWTNDDNFTYRDAYTGEGFTGTLELTEL